MKAAWRRITGIGLAVALLCGLVSGHGSASGPAVTFNSTAKTIDFTYGGVTLATGAGSTLTGMRHLTLNGLWNNAGATTTDVKKRHTTIGQDWEAVQAGPSWRRRCRGAARHAHGQPEGSAATDGITGVQWGLVLPDPYDLDIAGAGRHSPDGRIARRGLRLPAVRLSEHLGSADDPNPGSGRRHARARRRRFPVFQESARQARERQLPRRAGNVQPRAVRHGRRGGVDGLAGVPTRAIG